MKCSTSVRLRLERRSHSVSRSEASEAGGGAKGAFRGVRALADLAELAGASPFPCPLLFMVMRRPLGPWRR